MLGSVAVLLEVGVIDRGGGPKMVQHHSESSGRGDDGAFSRPRPTPGLKTLTKAAQVAVLAKGSQQVVSTLHQKVTQHGVALLADAQLGATLSGFAPCWHQSEIGPDLSTFGKTPGVLHDEDKSERRDCPYTSDLAQ